MGRQPGVWARCPSTTKKGSARDPFEDPAVFEGRLGADGREGAGGREAQEEQERRGDPIEQALELGERHDTHL